MLGNSVGIVDSDYRGEYMFQIYNFENKGKDIEAYERIWQIEFVPDFFAHTNIQDIQIPKIQMVVDANMYENFEQIFPTERGEWRFHSTGI
jgi:dUTPase